MLELNFNPFPVIETERMFLRKLELSDAADMHELRCDERVMQFIGRARSTCVEDMHELIEKVHADAEETIGISWGIQFRDSPGLIGSIGLYRIQKEHFRAEVGYILNPNHWGQGLMTEALKAVLKTSFEQFGFHSIEADTDPENVASNRILERNGFRLEGQFKDKFYFDGKFYDTNIYSILASEFSN